MKKVCIMSEIKEDNEWQKKYKKEHHDKQQAELETSLVKAIGINSPEMRAMKTKLSETEVILSGTKMIVEDGFKKIQAQQKEIDQLKQEAKDSFERIAELCEVNERHQQFNGKLQVRLTEIEQENIELHANNLKLKRREEEKLSNLRKSGL
jgi:predicted HicB family RNase H-like nuclease|tara:strand:+ start:760 stop:1212 length:453 start_codon:yes stop_codon:yes gene_type:complete